MRRGIIGSLITAFVMMGIGLTLMFSAIAIFGWNLLYQDDAYAETTHTITDKVTFLKVADVECDIRILPSDDGNCKVICSDSEKVFHTVSLDGQTLTVERVDGRKWYERIGIFLWWEEECSVSVYLPLGEYKNLTLKSVSGDIEVPDGYTFSSGVVMTTSGDISFESEVKEGFSAKSTSGDVSVRDMGAATVVAESTSGKVSLKNVLTSGAVTVSSTSGAIRLDHVIPGDLTVSSVSGKLDLSQIEAWGTMTLSTTSGDISFDYIGAHKDMKITSVSGEVEGSVVGRKKFSVKTLSGEVEIPKSGGDGLCEIETTSGDIEVSIWGEENDG